MAYSSCQSPISNGFAIFDVDLAGFSKRSCFCSKQDISFSTSENRVLIFLDSLRVMGCLTCKASCCLQSVSILQAFSRYLMRLSTSTGCMCSFTSSLISCIFLKFLRDQGAIPKASIQSQMEQPRQVRKWKSSEVMLWPLSSFSRDSATYSSYFFYEYEPIRKTIKPKTMPNKPPTYERTESNLPITRLTLKLLVDLNRLRVMNLEPTRETALVWNIIIFII